MKTVTALQSIMDGKLGWLGQGETREVSNKDAERLESAGLVQIISAEDDTPPADPEE